MEPRERVLPRGSPFFIRAASLALASLAMNIVRLMVFFVLGLLLGVLLPSLVTWELSPDLGDGRDQAAAV